MLRLIVLLLILANVLYYVWSHRVLGELGWGKAEQTEPHRLQQQIQPERIRVLEVNEIPGQNQNIQIQTQVAMPAAAAATAVETPKSTTAALSPTASTQCLQSAAYSDQQIEALRGKLAALLPVNSWQFEDITSQPNWLIYMGKYANNSMFELKKAELKKMQLAFSPINDGPMALGISLGQFPTQAQASQALTALNKRGIRTAKVVQEIVAGKRYRLVLPAIDTNVIPKINALTATAAGQALKPCNSKP